MLADVLELPVQQVHHEATKWESVLSTDVEKSIVAQLADPRLSPWGNPIPGLDQLGVRLDPPPLAVSITDALGACHAVHAVVRSVSEDAQDQPELISELVNAGIIPNAQVRIEDHGTYYVVRGLNTMKLSRRRAHIIKIDAIEAQSTACDNVVLPFT